MEFHFSWFGGGQAEFLPSWSVRGSVCFADYFLYKKSIQELHKNSDIEPKFAHFISSLSALAVRGLGSHSRFVIAWDYELSLGRKGNMIKH